MDTTKNSQKQNIKYFCEKCDYETFRKSDLQKHIKSKKHNTTKIQQKNSYKCECGKEYTHRASLFNHKKKCNYKEEKQENKLEENGVPQEEVNYKEVILTLINQNKELQDLLISQQDLLISQQEEYRKDMKNLILHIKPNNTVNKTINNNNNKTFNIMMFLNENCKDAMTIQDFAERLVVSIEDLEKKKFDCLSNTILKNLKSLSITERPVHCGNRKKKEWYLNDKEKGWEMDNGEKLIKNAEYGINKKFQNEFKKHYPNYSTVENIKDKYMQLINRTFTDLPENEKSRLLNMLSNDLLLEE
jgi:hypothetical protein